jgi:aspartate kinase
MKVLKFGGASVKSADGVNNLAEIVNPIKENHIIVISAMGKMTNTLEKLYNAYIKKQEDIQYFLEEINSFHLSIIDDLFETSDNIYKSYSKLFHSLNEKISIETSLNYDYEYDKIVSYGELFSTLIVSEYLNKIGQRNEWIDIRELIKTDDNYKEGKVNWKLSKTLCKKKFSFKETRVYITQGFIAGTATNQTTTLGREGSDFTAAILANILEAEEVSIWKDVPGIMNADPKEYADATIIKHLSYKETIELAHFGAKVIHPNTIKPLENKKIPLYVRSFIDPNETGSIVSDCKEKISLVPIYIHKREQSLISLSPKDFSFIEENEISKIFSIFIKHKLKTNLVQSSAISFSICCDYKKELLDSLFKDLKEDYFILYNKKTELITVRHYDKESLERATKERNILLEQRSRTTARFVVDYKD